MQTEWGRENWSTQPRKWMKAQAKTSIDKRIAVLRLSGTITRTAHSVGEDVSYTDAPGHTWKPRKRTQEHWAAKVTKGKAFQLRDELKSTGETRTFSDMGAEGTNSSNTPCKPGMLANYTIKACVGTALTLTNQQIPFLSPRPYC